MDEEFLTKRFHWMDLCIKCDKGGKLLVCHQNNCPIIVHQDCLGCAPKFDEMGNFCCPYCVYKMAIIEFGEAERKAVLAEKALSKYFDRERAGKEPYEVSDQPVQLEKHHQETTAPGCSLREKECFMRDTEADVSFQTQNRVGERRGLNDDGNHIKVVEKQYELEHVVGGCGDESCIGEVKVDEHQVEGVHTRQQSGEVEGDALQTEIVTKHHQDAKPLEAHSTREGDVEANDETEGRGNDEGQDQEEAQNTKKNIMCIESAPQVDPEINGGGSNTTTTTTCMDSKVISEKTPTVQSPRVHNLRRSSRGKSYVDVENSSTSCKSPKVAKPSKKFTVSPILKEKRKRLAWKEEEVEMLKKGVQRFSQTVNKNLPWQKILEEGRDVFDETRTPSDLKDKWKNILSKEPLFEYS